MVAILVLSIGVLALVTTFDSSRTEETKAEMHDTGNAMGERELNRITSQRWSQMALSGTPTVNGGATSTDPTYYISAGPCGSSNTPVTSPCYQWDWQNASSTEPLAIDTTNGIDSPTGTAWQTTVTSSGSGARLHGTIYRFITWVKDSSCTASGCSGSSDAKRVTIAVTVQGLSRPIWLSTRVNNPSGNNNNPLTTSSTSCVDGGVTVPCTH